MRPIIFVGICFVIGCGRAGSYKTDTPEPTGLYTDAEIRNLVNFDIDKVPSMDESDFSIFDVPALGVVPSGDSRPRGEVFKELGIDDKRIRDFRSHSVMMVDFLLWQVSPSYDICCMSAINDDDNHFAYTDPRLKVYGIRILKRSQAP